MSTEEPFGVTYVDTIKTANHIIGGSVSLDDFSECLFKKLIIKDCDVAKGYLPVSELPCTWDSPNVTIDLGTRYDFLEGLVFPEDSIQEIQLIHGIHFVSFIPTGRSFLPPKFLEYTFLGLNTSIQIRLKGVKSLEGISVLVGFLPLGIRGRVLKEGYPFSTQFFYNSSEYAISHGNTFKGANRIDRIS